MADVVYYNASFTNTSATARSASIAEFRNAPVLDDPTRYQMSVVRFDVATESIPIAAINNIAGGSATDCFVTVTYLGVDYPQQVNLTKSQTTNFNFVYSYQHWLDNINFALAAAFAAAALAGPIVGQLPPLLIWDPRSQLIRLFFSSIFLQNIPNPVTISVNSQLYRYLRGFEAFFNGYGTPLGKDYDLITVPSNTIAVPAAPRDGYPPIAAGYIYYVSQETISVGSWNPMRSLVLTSNMIPVRSEYVPSDVKVASGNGPSGNYQPILTDFLADQSNTPTDKRGVTVYLPTAEYRMADLVSQTPLYDIDLTASWADFNGVLYPILLGPGETFGAKLMFRRK